jgi:asparagine synthase (glutamine-hydrolysing)
MCGIIGFNFNDLALARKMCETLSHRGPDDEGFFEDKGITLGHRRLSIIDLNTGRQPIFNEDQSIVVIYNGEIYNFEELKKSLENNGHKFSTASDTEVIVHAYEEYGFDCVLKFNGMFAFALYDMKRQLLFLARDRCGIKPLHYYISETGTFIFASEIKAILQFKEIIPEIDHNSFHHLINLRYLPGEMTMFKNIKKILPGHYGVYADNFFTTKKYWEPKYEFSNFSEEYYLKVLRNLLESAVKRHLISDVPLGIMLSGGIDSSTVVALASKMSENPLKTFCMGFGRPNDEIQDASYVADYFGTDHHQLIIEDTLLRDYPKMIWFADEPKRNLYPFYISEMVSKHVKTVLGGLGSDELFGGYIFKYKFVERIEKIREHCITQRKKTIQEYADHLIRFQTNYGDIIDDEHLDYLESIKSLDNNIELYLITQTQDKVFNEDYLEKIYGSTVLKEKLNSISDTYTKCFNNNYHLIDQVLLADFSYKMIDDFLLVDDRMNMANSIESRVPFLDNHLVAFSLSLPSIYKTSDPDGKYILKKAMRDILPKRVLEKKKQGFSSGTYEVFLKEGRELSRQILPEGNLVKDGLIRKEYIEKIINEIPNPKLSLHYGTLWNILASEIWYNMYIIGDIRNLKFDLNKIVY